MNRGLGIAAGRVVLLFVLTLVPCAVCFGQAKVQRPDDGPPKNLRDAGPRDEVQTVEDPCASQRQHLKEQLSSVASDLQKAFNDTIPERGAFGTSTHISHLLPSEGDIATSSHTFAEQYRHTQRLSDDLEGLSCNDLASFASKNGLEMLSEEDLADMESAEATKLAHDLVAFGKSLGMTDGEIEDLVGYYAASERASGQSLNEMIQGYSNAQAMLDVIDAEGAVVVGEELANLERIREIAIRAGIDPASSVNQVVEQLSGMVRQDPRDNLIKTTSEGTVSILDTFGDSAVNVIASGETLTPPAGVSQGDVSLLDSMLRPQQGPSFLDGTPVPPELEPFAHPFTGQPAAGRVAGAAAFFVSEVGKGLQTRQEASRTMQAVHDRVPEVFAHSEAGGTILVMKSLGEMDPSLGRPRQYVQQSSVIVGADPVENLARYFSEQKLVADHDFVEVYHVGPRYSMAAEIRRVPAPEINAAIRLSQQGPDAIDGHVETRQRLFDFLYGDLVGQ